MSSLQEDGEIGKSREERKNELRWVLIGMKINLHNSNSRKREKLVSRPTSTWCNTACYNNCGMDILSCWNRNRLLRVPVLTSWETRKVQYHKLRRQVFKKLWPKNGLSEQKMGYWSTSVRCGQEWKTKSSNSEIVYR